MNIKMKRGRGNCAGCFFLNRAEMACAKPKEIKIRCIRKESTLFSVCLLKDSKNTKFRVSPVSKV